MANHQARGNNPKLHPEDAAAVASINSVMRGGPKSEPAPLPRVKWISLVQTSAGWQVALLETQGDSIVSGPTPYGVPERERLHAEERLRIGVANEIMGLVPEGGR